MLSLKKKNDGEEPQNGRVVALKSEQIDWMCTGCMDPTQLDSWVPRQQKRGRVTEPFIEEISNVDVPYLIQLSSSSQISQLRRCWVT